MVFLPIMSCQDRSVFSARPFRRFRLCLTEILAVSQNARPVTHIIIRITEITSTIITPTFPNSSPL